MPAYIIHKDGAFNVFSSVVDACYFEPALTRVELEKWYRDEYGKSGMLGLPERIKRATDTGTSAMGGTIDGHIDSNRCGPREGKITKAEFIRRFLTIIPSSEIDHPPASAIMPTR